MVTMNENDKNLMLDELLQPGQNYQLKIWGTIMADAKTFAMIGAISAVVGSAVAAMGALSNAYCYIGATEDYLNFVVVDSLNVRKVLHRFSIPFNSMTSAKVKKGLLGRTIIILKFGNQKMKLALMNNTIGSDLVGQKEGVAALCSRL